MIVNFLILTALMVTADNARCIILKKEKILANIDEDVSMAFFIIHHTVLIKILSTDGIFLYFIYMLTFLPNNPTSAVDDDFGKTC